MKQLKIEAGKPYRTRDGRKAEVFCTDFRKEHDCEEYIIGRIFLKDKTYRLMTWFSDGRFDEKENINDLVSEWKEPSYRPYSWEEAQLTIGEVVKAKEDKHVSMITTIIDREGLYPMFSLGDREVTAAALLDFYTFLDGSPCGVKEG